MPGSDPTTDRWFDTAAFELPASFTFGSAPRNSVRGPGFAKKPPIQPPAAIELFVQELERSVAP